MTAIVYSGALVLVSIFAVTQAYFPARQPGYYGSPWSAYDTSCRDSIEDLKALMEVTQTMKQDDKNYMCPTCANTFSEEIIMKLINALIFTATHNCGYNNGGGSYYPGGNYPGGGNTGVVNPGGTGQGSGSGTSVQNNGGLINLGVLDGTDTLGLSLGGTKLVGVDVGQQGSGSSSTGSSGGDGLVQLDVLDNGSLANVGLAGTSLVNVGLGNDGPGVPTTAPGASSPVSTLPVNTGAIDNTLGGVTNPMNAGDVNQVNQQAVSVTKVVN